LSVAWTLLSIAFAGLVVASRCRQVQLTASGGKEPD